MNDNNIQNTNIENENIEPIPEIKVETMEPVKQEITVTDTASKNTVEPKNSKVTTVLLVLLFGFLFIYIMAMPYITDFINEMNNKENTPVLVPDNVPDTENKTDQSNNNEVATKELVCTSLPNMVDSYTLIQVEKFNYDSNNQILSSKIISKYTFNLIDDTYESLKKQCEENSLKYLTHDGYTVACMSDNTNIEISHEFDLETFVAITDDNTNIEANSKYKQNIDEVKAMLINKGYTCE